jgi:hypothetical protein
MAQTADIAEQSRQRIISDLVFIYVDKPQLPMSDATASTTLVNSDIAANTNMTGAFWTNANNSGSQDLVKLLLQPATNQNTRILQYLVATILQIQEKRVKVFLFNDKNNSSLTTYHASWSIDSGVYGSNEHLTVATPNPWVWPHAMHQPQGEFAGYISMGSAFLTDYIEGKEEAIATILHELTHTQDNAQFATVYSAMAYGMDGGHNFNELLSNFYAAYTEGIANSFSMMYLFSQNLNVYRWLRENSRLNYERMPSWACVNFPPNSCLDVYLRNSHSVEPDTSIATPAQGTTQAYTRDFYRIRNLPSDVLTQNEAIQASVFYTYMRYFSVAALANSLKQAIPLTRDNYGFAYIFEEMVKNAHTAGQASATPANAEYFPIAVLDYMTGFKLSNEAIMNLCLRTRNTSNWTMDVSDYWTDQHRGRILQRHNDTYSNSYSVHLLFDIAVQYNIRSRQPAAGSSN